MGIEIIMDNAYLYSIMRGWWIQNELEEGWIVETQVYGEGILSMITWKNRGWAL